MTASLSSINSEDSELLQCQTDLHELKVKILGAIPRKLYS